MIYRIQYPQKIRGLFLLLMTSLLMISGMSIIQTEAQTTASAVVTANHLNVRDYPNHLTGNIIARIGQNEVYIATAQSSINHWWQLRLSDGRLGWVNGNYITVYNGHLAPVINPGQVAPPIQTTTATVTANHLNVRHIPNPYTGTIIARVSQNEVYTVIGRNANASWWQLRLNDGRLGWVNGNYISLANPGIVPITDNSLPNPPAVTTTGTVTAYFLNVRTAPSALHGLRIEVIANGQVFEVVGRNSTNTWWQIRLNNGGLGWVSGYYFNVVNGHLVPVIL